MKRNYKKIGLSVLFVVSILFGLANMSAVVTQAKTEDSSVSVKAKIGSKKINKTTYTMKKGTSKKIRRLITPKKSNVKTRYRSSKKSIVSVSKTGVLRAKKAGTVKITIKVKGKENLQKKICFKVKVVKENTSGKKKEIPVTLTVDGKNLQLNFTTILQRGNW